MENQASGDHPIKDHIFESTYQEFDDPESGYQRAYYHEVLARVQDVLEDGHFETLLMRTLGNTENEIERVYDYGDPNVVAFVDYGVISKWEDLFSGAELTDPHARDFIETVHTRQIEEVDPELVGPIEESEVSRKLLQNDLRDDGWVGLVVKKPQSFRVGEKTMAKQLDDLLRQGSTPAEVLDFLFVELEGKSENDLAIVHDRDRSTISDNVSKARKSIDRSRELYADPPDAMIEGYKEYRGETDEEDVQEDRPE